MFCLLIQVQEGCKYCWVLGLLGVTENGQESWNITLQRILDTKDFLYILLIKRLTASSLPRSMLSSSSSLQADPGYCSGMTALQ